MTEVMYVVLKTLSGEMNGYENNAVMYIAL